MQLGQLKRREFVTLLAGAAIASPLQTLAQQAALPVIGFLNTQSPGVFAHLVAGFRQGLGEAGYFENRNVAIEYRWAENQYDRLPGLVDDLVHHPVAVIAATGGGVAALAAKAATATIPMVFVLGDLDPVRAGLVTSLNRPSGNITGLSFLVSALIAKRLELLKELVPNATSIGMLLSPDSPDAEAQSKDVQDAARALGQQIHVLEANSDAEIEAAFATFIARGVGALVIGADPFVTSRRHEVIALAARYGLPTIYPVRDIAEAGGLMSYGSNIVDTYRQAGIYTGSILKGTKPADLPVLQPTKFELVINLRTAKALGIEVPAKLLVFADEVIQ
jgi:putative tryptophan/tyrosine transport system substrate-binding protein